MRTRTTKIEFESNFSSISQHLRSTEYNTFLIAEKFENYIDPLRLNVRLILAVYHNNLMAIYLSDHWKVISASLYLIAIYLSDC